jgi:hypothetical protein
MAAEEVLIASTGMEEGMMFTPCRNRGDSRASTSLSWVLSRCSSGPPGHAPWKTLATRHLSSDRKVQGLLEWKGFQMGQDKEEL